MPDTSAPEIPPIFVSIKQAGDLLGFGDHADGGYMAVWKLLKAGHIESRTLESRRRMVVLQSLRDFADRRESA